MKYFDTMIRLDQNSSDAYYGKANTLSRMGNYTEALKEYNEAASISFIDDPDFYVHKGNALLNLGYYDDAIKEYQRSLRLDPINSTTYVYKGDALAKLAKTYQNFSDQLPYFNKALKEYNESIKNNENNTNAYSSKANLYFATGKYPEALEELVKAFKIDPDSYSQPILQKGMELYRQNKLNLSLLYFDSLIREDPKNANAYFAKGNVLFRLGNSAEALKVYEEGIKLDPLNSTSFIFNGNPYSQLGINNITKNNNTLNNKISIVT